MANSTTTPRAPVRLSFEAGQVLVTPQDRSTFFLSAEKAVGAYRAALGAEERFVLFEQTFLMPLHQWCVAHADKVRACYVPLTKLRLQVFVLTNNPQFDYDLAREIAELELRLVRSGWRLSAMQLPQTDDEEQATFFNLDGALEVYAQRRPASNQG